MTLDELRNDVHFLCGTTSASYSNTNIDRNLNIALQDVARVIWESDNTWSFQDANDGSDPVAYRTLGNASGSYKIPTTVLTVKAVEIKDSGGNWWKLKPKSLYDLEVSPEEYLPEAGLPVAYSLDGNDVRLYPPASSASVTLTSGMCLRLSPLPLTLSAATASPGFAAPFHRILSYAASIDFTQDEKQRQFHMAQKLRLEKGLSNFYSHRAVEMPIRIKPHSQKKWRQYT